MKMKENKTKDTLNREKGAKLGRRILIISVCAFVLLVTVFACVLGTVSAIKSRNSAGYRNSFLLCKLL